MPDARPVIHWVSPLPPAETDIAHYTRRILPALCARADVTLWTDATTWDRELDRFCPVRSLDPLRVRPRDMTPKGRCDTRPGTVFINMGNAWLFHAGLLLLARRMPSVIVLHDLCVQEMLHDAIGQRILGKAEYLSAMQRWYGPAGRAAAMRALDGTIPVADLDPDFPGFDLALDQAIAALTHTSAASHAVANRGAVPAYQLDLPFAATGSGRKRQAGTGPLRLVQFGHIGPNKRLEQVLDALAAMGPGFDFVLDVVGRVWAPDFITRKCAALGLADKVRLHGHVPEPHLDTLIGRAHLVFNLRHPTMGEASGSQLRIWNAAAASVVTDRGWYAELPRDTVFHIPLDGEIGALCALLARLERDRDLGRAVGAAGRRHLMAHHDPERYADGIIEIAGNAARDTRDSLLAGAARRGLARGQDVAGLRRDRLTRLF